MNIFKRTRGENQFFSKPLFFFLSLSKDFEFLIVNDGSKDKSSEIVSQFVQKDRRIRLIDQDNKGLVAALNRGLEEARGTLIARIDADDIAYPNRLEKQVAHMSENPEVIASGSSITLIDTQGQIIRQIRQKGSARNHQLSSK